MEAPNRLATEEPVRPWRAVLLALILGVVGLGYALLPDRVLLPEDPRVYPPLGAVEDAPVDTATLDKARVDAVPSRRDAILQFLPFDHSVRESWSNGEAPLWETRYLCGAPMLAQATSRAFYPTTILFSLLGPGGGRAWAWLIHLVLAGLFAYLLARRFGAAETGALLANASLVLSGYAWGHVQHPMIFMAAIWLLPAIYFTDRLLTDVNDLGTRSRLTIGLALSVALSWFAGFAQASVLLVYAVTTFAVVLGITRLRHERRIPGLDLALCAGGVAVGLALATPQILPTIELSEHTARLPYEAAHQRHHALTIAHLLEFVFPGQLAAPGDVVIQGTPRPTWLALTALPATALEPLARSVYNHTETAFAFGVWPFVFAILAIVSIFSRVTPRRSARATLAALSILGLLVALATPGILELVRVLPGAAIGDVKRSLMLPGILLPVLAGCGFRRPRGGFAMTALIAGFVFVALGLALFSAKQESLASRLVAILAWRRDYGVDTVADAFAVGELAANQFLLARGAMLLGLALLLGGALGPLRRGTAIVFLGVTILELLPVAWQTTPAPAASALDTGLPRALETRRDEAPFAPRILRIERNTGSAAEVSLWPPNLPLRSGFADVLGYAPVAPRRYEQFISLIEADAATGGAGISKLQKPESLAHRLLSLCAVEYAITNFDRATFPEATRANWEDVAEVRGAHVSRQKTAPPRVRLYSVVRTVEPDAVAATLREEGFDPTKTLVLETDTKRPVDGPFPYDMTDRLEIESWRSGRIQLRYETSAPALAFVAEGYMPGWRATIRPDEGDPIQLETRPAQLAFQAFELPAGKGTIDLRYAPMSFFRGLMAASAALLSILATLIMGLFLKQPTASTTATPEGGK